MMGPVKLLNVFDKIAAVPLTTRLPVPLIALLIAMSINRNLSEPFMTIGPEPRVPAPVSSRNEVAAIVVPPENVLLPAIGKVPPAGITKATLPSPLSAIVP